MLVKRLSNDLIFNIIVAFFFAKTRKINKKGTSERVDGMRVRRAPKYRRICKLFSGLQVYKNNKKYLQKNKTKGGTQMAEKIKFDENEDLLVSTEQICKLFAISRAALNKWVSSGCPKHSRGWFLLKDVLEWKGDNVSEKMQGTSAKAKKVLYEAQYKEEQVKALKFKNAQQEGLYLDRENVETELKRLLIILKTSLQGMATTISTELALYVDSETARLLDTQIKNIVEDALNQMRIDGIYEQKRSSK